MNLSPSKAVTTKFPVELLSVLGDPPLAGYEVLADYYELFGAVVDAVKPKDTINWLHVKSVVDLTWEIQREQKVKIGIIELMQEEVIQDLLKATQEDSNHLDAHVRRVFDPKRNTKNWATDLVARKEIDAQLGAKGYPPSEVLARAYIKGASEIDAVERRIASYELRRIVVLREIERRDDRLARDLQKVTSRIIDGELAETRAGIQ
jgi:hypothetical protein